MGARISWRWCYRLRIIGLRFDTFYRSGSTKQELKGAALDQFLLRKQGRHWDGVPAPGFGLADLDPQAIAHFRRAAAQSGCLSKALLAERDATLISKLRLTDGDYLKRPALLLFGRDPERLITGAYVKISFFRTDTDLLYHDEIHGDLFTQVERTVDLLLTKHLHAGLSYEGLRRIERFPIPERGLREAVINAVAHKDYATAIPIQISDYADRLMLWNPGQLPHGWTLARLSEKHASHPFNPDIANAFFRTAYLESWGRGIELITEACLEHGSSPPALRWDNGLWVEFGFLSERQRQDSQETAQETTQETAQETTPRIGTAIPPPPREKILSLLRADPTLPRKALAVQLKLSPDGVKYHLTQLKAAGRLRRVGPTKGGRWEVVE